MPKHIKIFTLLITLMCLAAVCPDLKAEDIVTGASDDDKTSSDQNELDELYKSLLKETIRRKIEELESSDMDSKLTTDNTIYLNLDYKMKSKPEEQTPGREKPKEIIRKGKHIGSYKFRVVKEVNGNQIVEFNSAEWLARFFPKGALEGGAGCFTVRPEKQEGKNDEKTPLAEPNKDSFEMTVKVFADAESAVDALEESLLLAEKAKEGSQSGGKFGDNCYWLPAESDRGTIFFTRKNVLVVLNGRQDWSYSYRKIEALAGEIDKSILAGAGGFKLADMKDFIRVIGVKFPKMTLRRNAEAGITFIGANIPDGEVKILDLDEKSFRYDSKNRQLFLRMPDKTGEVNLSFRIMDTKKGTVSERITIQLPIKE
ncbi:MAG: hypothetical protein HY811_02555 [Planctomycetes bacterium]|nr:hypothetical protein [Planctomycetota bacterium]